MTYEITDIPQSENCQNCNTCLRLRLMEMGFISGEQIDIISHNLGLWKVNILSDNGYPTSTFALRDDEFERICFL